MPQEVSNQMLLDQVVASLRDASHQFAKAKPDGWELDVTPGSFQVSEAFPVITGNDVFPNVRVKQTLDSAIAINVGETETDASFSWQKIYHMEVICQVRYQDPEAFTGLAEGFGDYRLLQQLLEDVTDIIAQDWNTWLGSDEKHGAIHDFFHTLDKIPVAPDYIFEGRVHFSLGRKHVWS